MNKAKLLLAEDDLNLGSLLKQYLVAKNYDIDLVFDGDTAYKLFMKNNYDLCILDVMMPNVYTCAFYPWKHYNAHRSHVFCQLCSR